jgi:tetratricopeptide (TPR) repeat protein
LEPDDLTFQKNLADFYYVAQGRVQDALEIYVRVLTEEPTDIETLMAAAHICKALYINDKAKIFYDRVLEIEPWNLTASENLNQLKPTQSGHRDASFENPSF